MGGDATSEASPTPGAEEPTAGAQAPPGQSGGGETVDISDVQVGDCFVDNTDIGADISTVQVVACTTAHNSEIILVDEAFFAAAQTMPSEKAMSEQAEPACLAALESYTGQAYADSEYDFWYIFPSADGWMYDRGRGLICVGVLTSGADSTESMKAG